MAEGQILCDAVNIGGSEHTRLAQGSSPFGTFALKQMTPTGAAEENFAGAGDLETFGYGLFGFNALGTSHRSSFI